MPDDKAARIAALRAQRDAIDAEILRLSREAVADMAGLTGEMRAVFMEGLQPITKPGTVMGNMIETHRVALSRAAVKRLKQGRSAPDGPFMAAIQAKGFTQATLAAAIGIKQPTLSAHRKSKDDPNSRPIPTSRALRIQELTGWAADARHWPCGLSD